MKKNLLFLLALSFSLIGCEKDEEKPAENSQPTENQEIEQGENEQEENTENLQEYTATIPLSGTDFNPIATDAGVQIDSTDYANNKKKFVDYCDSFLEYENLISDIVCTNLNTAKVDGVTYLCVGTGAASKDKFKEGSLKWKSGKKIYKVEIKAMAYSKLNDYLGVTNADTLSHVWIDANDYSLECEESATPEIKTFSSSYSSGVQSFTIKATGSRVLLKEMIITWRG